jgi:hypothetical protein
MSMASHTHAHLPVPMPMPMPLPLDMAMSMTMAMPPAEEQAREIAGDHVFDAIGGFFDVDACEFEFGRDGGGAALARPVPKRSARKGNGIGVQQAK